MSDANNSNMKTGKKPIWKRWWFIAIIALTIVGLIMDITEEITKSPETRAKEQAENRTRDSIKLVENRIAKLGSYRRDAYDIAQHVIKARLKFPLTAEFPSSASLNEYEGEGMYHLRGGVTAKNAFGVPSESVWKVRLRYKGEGEPSEAKNWVTVEALLE